MSSARESDISLQLLLIVPFMRFGELVLRVPPVHVIPKHLSDLTHPGEALKGLGHALVGWLLVSAIIAWPVATLLTPAFAYLKQRYAAFLCLQFMNAQCDGGLDLPLFEATVWRR